MLRVSLTGAERAIAQASKNSLGVIMPLPLQCEVLLEDYSRIKNRSLIRVVCHIYSQGNA